VSKQECSTRYRIQSEAVKVDALIPSGDYYFQRLLGFLPHRCMRWGHPPRRTPLSLGAEVKITSVRFGSALPAEDQVALGDFSPRAPTDPYVPALEHTVPQVMVSLREVEAWNELRVREQAGSDGAMRRISPSASSGRCCGG
jgi:hypothetical protein